MAKDLDQILKEQNSKLRISITIFLSLSVAAVVLIAAKQVMGWVFLCMFVLMGTALFVRVRRYRAELAKLGNRESFSRQLEQDALYEESMGLTITRDFALLERPYLQVYPLADMEKFEVGLAGSTKKVLFLTDRKGVRHPIAEGVKDEPSQEPFDRAYIRIRDRFHEINQDGKEGE